MALMDTKYWSSLSQEQQSYLADQLISFKAYRSGISQFKYIPEFKFLEFRYRDWWNFNYVYKPFEKHSVISISLSTQYEF